MTDFTKNKYGLSQAEVTHLEETAKFFNAEPIKGDEADELFYENEADNFCLVAMEMFDKDGEAMLARMIYQDPTRCCICGDQLPEKNPGRNDPDPVVPRGANHHDEDGYNCCDSCNKLVIRSRIEMMKGAKFRYLVNRKDPDTARRLLTGAMEEKHGTVY